MFNWKNGMKKTVAGMLAAAGLLVNIQSGFCQQSAAPGNAAVEQQADILPQTENDHAVSDTAYITLYWLASAGNEKAKLLLDTVNVNFQNLDSASGDFDRIRVTNREYQKLRHDSLNEYVLNHGYRSVMDLASGYSPRGLELSEAGIDYVGCDFASVTESMQKLTERCVDPAKKHHLRYATVDGTKHGEMDRAADNLDGPVCIVTEGLFMYLDREETTAVLRNISDILKAKGGCFVTQDFSTRKFVTAVAEALYPQQGRDIYDASAKMYNDTSGYIMITEYGEDTAEIKEIMKKLGLKFKQIRLMKNAVPSPANDMNKEQRERLSKVTENKFMWVVTAR